MITHSFKLAISSGHVMTWWEVITTNNIFFWFLYKRCRRPKRILDLAKGLIEHSKQFYLTSALANGQQTEITLQSLSQAATSLTSNH